MYANSLKYSVVKYRLFKKSLIKINVLLKVHVLNKVLMHIWCLLSSNSVSINYCNVFKATKVVASVANRCKITRCSLFYSRLYERMGFTVMHKTQTYKKTAGNTSLLKFKK